jgi:hypothetical protein
LQAIVEAIPNLHNFEVPGQEVFESIVDDIHQAVAERSREAVDGQQGIVVPGTSGSIALTTARICDIWSHYRADPDREQRKPAYQQVMLDSVNFLATSTWTTLLPYAARLVDSDAHKSASPDLTTRFLADALQIAQELSPTETARLGKPGDGQSSLLLHGGVGALPAPKD